jgi:hypothetical protein
VLGPHSLRRGLRHAGPQGGHLRANPIPRHPLPSPSQRTQPVHRTAWYGMDHPACNVHDRCTPRSRTSASGETARVLALSACAVRSLPRQAQQPKTVTGTASRATRVPARLACTDQPTRCQLLYAVGPRLAPMGSHCIRPSTQLCARSTPCLQESECRPYHHLRRSIAIAPATVAGAPPPDCVARGRATQPPSPWRHTVHRPAALHTPMRMCCAQREPA